MSGSSPVFVAHSNSTRIELCLAAIRPCAGTKKTWFCWCFQMEVSWSFHKWWYLSYFIIESYENGWFGLTLDPFMKTISTLFCCNSILTFWGWWTQLIGIPGISWGLGWKQRWASDASKASSFSVFWAENEHMDQNYGPIAIAVTHPLSLLCDVDHVTPQILKK